MMRAAHRAASSGHNHDEEIGVDEIKNSRGPYKNGLQRRSQIIQHATEVFAAHGFAGGSLREIADRVEVTPAALLRHFGGKEDLLVEVLKHWDEHQIENENHRFGLEYFESLREITRYNMEHRGFLELYITLGMEATDPEHPAYPFIAERQLRTLDSFRVNLRRAVERGEIPPMGEGTIESESRILLALFDGLAVQWLLVPDVDLTEVIGGALDSAIARWKHPRTPAAPAGETSADDLTPAGEGAPQQLGVRLTDQPTGEMRAVVISGPGHYGLITKPVPRISSDELLLEPIAVGICRTDIELLDGTMVYIRDGRSRLPLTPGHEWVARVAAVGAAVTGFTVGQRVVGECSIGCRVCAVCRSGNYHQCPDRRETGVMNLDGAMGGYFAFPARAAHLVPDNIDDLDAVFAEPAAVALRAVLRTGLEPGESVLVVGGGTIGWLATALILDIHDADVAVSELDTVRLDRLVGLGARSTTADDRFDVVIEASGSAGGLKAGLESLAPSGRLVAVGLSGLPSIDIDVDRLVVNDHSIIGSLGSPDVWPATLARLGSGRVRPSVIVTDTRPLSEFSEAIDSLRNETPGSGKVLILPGPDDRARPPIRKASSQ